MTVERLRYSLRLLRRHKRFTAMAVVCLGVAIAINTTMYSVLDAMINPKIDIREPLQIHTIALFGDYRRQIQPHEREAALRDLTFQAGLTASMYDWNERIAERGPHLREIMVNTVAPNYFEFLGVRATAGRLIGPQDLGSSLRPVVIGERLWKQLFPEMKRFEPADILLGGNGRRVVGLLAYSSDFPGSRTDIWQLPLPENMGRMIPRLIRLRSGVTLAQANVELANLSQRHKTIAGPDVGWLLRPGMGEPFRAHNFHKAMIGAVVAVLLIACANLANLQLARGVSRARELATRAAVGATRSDIVRQLVLESTWLAIGGLLLGAVLTIWGIRLIDHFLPKAVMGYVTHPQLSWRVALFAVGVMLLCLMLIGLFPAIKLSRVNINELLQSGAGTGKTASARRQYGLLVVTEVALALALLCSTGLLVKSAMQVRLFEGGAEMRGLVYGGAQISRAHAADNRTKREWSAMLINHAMRGDSITGAATVTRGCPKRSAVTSYDLAGQPVALPAPLWCYSIVSPDFFRVSNLPIVEGRDFSPGEHGEVQVMVDELAARSLWPGKSAIGRQIKLDSAHVPGPWYRVVGVVGERRRWFSPNQDEVVAQRIIRAAEGRATRMRGSVYILNAHDTARISDAGRGSPQNWIDIVIRGRGDVRRLPTQLYAQMNAIGPNVRASYPRTWDEMTGVARYKAQHDFMASLFGTFAFFALMLAALGVYAIIAHMVAQRRREFGVRIAVGAGAKDIREMVIREGNILALLGIAAGLIITWKSAAYVRAFVFSDWDRYDSRVFAVVALVLFGTAWLASYLPARRAMRIDPVEALRND